MNMISLKQFARAASAAVLLMAAACSPGGEKGASSSAPAGDGTKFALDASWPKMLPDNWQIGPLTGIYVDKHGLVWTANQSVALNDYDTVKERGAGYCCIRAPEVIAFNDAGDVVKSWRTSGEAATKGGYMPSARPHTIYVDDKDNVWLTGHGEGETHVLKFDYNGKFLMQIGGSTEVGCCGNSDTKNIHGGTGIAVWPATNEVFVTDGYENRRIIVFDADTGAFKRMWGAYGKPPPKDAYDPKLKRMASPEPTRTFEGAGAESWSTVHGVTITPDGTVWVADRVGNRIQRFKIDGTYIDEHFVARESTFPTGTVYNFSFSRDPDMKYVYIGDGGNKKVHILDRKTMKEVGFIGGCGGQMIGCLNHVHLGVTDMKGNVYTGEAAAGARIQRWNLVK